jgi:hypothetical protein
MANQLLKDGASAYDSSPGWSEGNDYVKVLAAAGTKIGTYAPPNGVAEPASLALVAMALVGAGAVRRRSPRI